VDSIAVNIGVKRESSIELNSRIESQIKSVESQGMLDYGIDPRSAFNLDTTKLAYHQERVDAWRMGKRVAPITIDMALTQKCSYACTFCYAGLQQNPSSPVPWNVYSTFLDDCAEIGHAPGHHVKAISLVSDGESTENPDIYKFISKTVANGIDIALGTNGLKLPKSEYKLLVESLTYLRINFNAGEADAYASIMGTAPRNFDKVCENISGLVEMKKSTGSKVTIGLQMVLMPEYADQVIPLALLGRELGVDYLVIKHCSDDEDGRLGVDYKWYVSPIAERLLHVAEALSTKDYSVQAKWSKMRTGRDRKYSKCFGTPLLLQMSGTGIVAPCGSFFHNDYSKFHIGCIAEKRFSEIWASDEYGLVMDYLKSDKFDPRKQCATLCLQDKVNEALFELIESGTELSQNGLGESPAHINFI
jgi:MoaA/NifB/PqqE/SkfB family radical SAM enzyme